MTDTGNVVNDIEERLAAAAARLRGHDLTAAQATELGRRRDALAAEVAARRTALASEQRDVDRLENLSLTRIVASLTGSRDDRLAREQAEAEAAQYRVAEAEAQLRSVDGEWRAARARLAELASAPAGYAAVLEEKERYLSRGGDPRGRRLLELAEERGRLTGEAREVAEALAAAASARDALSAVQSSLDSASGWSTYDTFFGGGAISSAMKHSRLDDAARQAARADHALLALRTELADVGGVAHTAPQLAIDGLTRFVDIWFDNVFTDFAVRGRIKQAQENVGYSSRAVHEVARQLRQRGAAINARLSAIEADRLAVLTGR